MGYVKEKWVLREDLGEIILVLDTDKLSVAEARRLAEALERKADIAAAFRCSYPPPKP